MTVMKKTYLGRQRKTGSLRTNVTLRQKPPCLFADPLECNQQVCSVISSVIIFRTSIQADGQATEQWTLLYQPDVYSERVHVVTYAV